MINNISLFFGGISTLVAGTGIAVYACVRKPNLKRRLDSLRAHVRTSTFLQKVRSEKAWAEHKLEIAKEKLKQAKAITRDRRDASDRYDLKSEAWKYGFYTTAFFVADAALMARLSGPTYYLGGDPQFWSFWAPFVAAGTFLACDLPFQICFHNTEQPARARKIALWIAVPVAIAAFGAHFVSASQRGVGFIGASAEELVIDSLRVLTATLAIVGGATAFATWSAWKQAKPHFDQESFEADVDQFGKFIDELEQQLKPQDSNSPPQVSGRTEQEVRRAPSRPPSQAPAARVSTSAKRGRRLNGAAHPSTSLMLALAFVGLLAGGVGGSRAYAASNGSVTALDYVSSEDLDKMLRPSGSVLDGSCEFDVDVSGSEGNERATIGEKLPHIVPLAAESSQCTVLKASAFVGNPFQAIEEYALPTAKSAPLPCELQHQEGVGSPLSILYPLSEAQKRSDAAKLCSDQRLQRDAQSMRLRRNALGDIGAKIGALSGVTRVGGCTDVFEVTARAMMRSQHLFVVTDGSHDCTWPVDAAGRPLTVPVPTGETLHFLLVPSASDRDTGQATLRRAAHLKSIFPGARIAFLNEAVLPSFWASSSKRAQ